MRHIGLGKFALATIGVVVFTAVFLFARSGITPASVSVRGYTRSDGTYVNSYSRRPPGAVAHDAPFEAVTFVTFVADAASFIWLIALCRRIGRLDHVRIFVGKIRWVDPYPKMPTPVILPTLSARARKTWQCSKCGAFIRHGDEYYYTKDQRGVGRDHTCRACRAAIEKEYPAYIERKTHYDMEMIRVRESRVLQLTQEYQRKFRRPLGNPWFYV